MTNTANTQHTPAPWEVTQYGIKHISPSGEAVLVAKCARTSIGKSSANAHLIASAPELHECCRLAFQYLHERWDEVQSDINAGLLNEKLTAALNKAETGRMER